jgi:hypothetical protein
MPSPFPGMNPYLEQADVWDDFHQSFLTEMRNHIAAQAGRKYIVKLEAKVYLHEVGSDERAFLGRGDIGLSHAGSEENGGAAVDVIEAPVLVSIPEVDQARSSYIEIRDRERRTLVTVIEMLSPTNKYSGPDREAFLAKRQNFIHSPLSYVEIDLMRGGPRMPIKEMTACDYCYFVHRAVDRLVAGFWPLRLREPLPPIPVPLRYPDADLSLDVQALIHTVYDAAHYENYIYAGRPEPPLSPPDAEWARQLIPAAAQ